MKGLNELYLISVRLTKYYIRTLLPLDLPQATTQL